MVFVHPARPLPPLAGVPGPLVDYPYASRAVSAEFSRILDEETGLTAEQATAINSGNAKNLFLRFQ
ncbi:hypothetical protein [Mycobacterium sp. 141]|uniref:hypothetical protein n=1 Tax=Mycobacterium sp. 141 TaxID=1120797 RepID=UPI0003790F50|nr:hypothetical protein [Mycobacterium sp. 141]